MTDLITKRTSYDWVLEILSWIGIICALIPIYQYMNLRDDFLAPVHFDFKGEADSWGDKEHILYNSFLSIFFFILMSCLEKNYKILNYPIKVTENNRLQLYRLGVELVRHIKLVIICLFSYLANSPFYVVEGDKNKGQLPLLFLICILLVVLVYFAVRMIGLKKV